MSSFSQYSDEELIFFLKQDNEAAFNELYDRFWKPLYVKAYSFLKSDSDAKDCVQNLFVSLWKNRHISSPQKVDHYMYQAIRYQVFNIFNQKKNILGLDQRIIELTNTVLQGNDTQYKELKEALDSIISKLPPENKELFLLNRESGLTYKEIAELKNISVKTVEKKISQALHQLRENWTNTVIAYLIMHFVQK